MQSNRKSRGEPEEEFASPAKEDAAWQRRVLTVLLVEAPHPLSQEEIERELLAEDAGFSERDGIERALDDLERVGLVRRNGELFSPTRAARHMDSLGEGLGE